VGAKTVFATFLELLRLLKLFKALAILWNQLPTSLSSLLQRLSPLEKPNSTSLWLVSMTALKVLSLFYSLLELTERATGGPLDICSICRVLDCDANIALDESWVEENPRFTALNWQVNGKKIGMVTLPGEPLIELGWMVRNDTLELGFDNSFLLGYSNK
jgi:hypothetical protein